MDTKTVDLGPCQCPGTPHERDSAEIIRPERLRFGIIRRVRSARDLEIGSAAAGGDPQGGLAMATLIALATDSWTLVDEAGKPLPIGLFRGTAALASVDDLTADQAQALFNAFNEEAYTNVILNRAQVPNPSSAPSAAGQPATASTDSPPSRTD